MDANKSKNVYKTFLVGGSFIILSTMVIFAIKASKN